jgi:hypothetical protein
MEQLQMLGALLSAGSSIIGGLLGKSSADKAADAQREMNERNIALQKEFAQSGIQWRVEDAKKAGIHPIYALGSGGASFTPVSSNFTADTSMANAFASAGQDIGRAVNATRGQSARLDAFSKTAQALQLENMGLQNDVLRTEIASKTARLNQQTNPPMPSASDAWLIPGQPASGPAATLKSLIDDQAMKRTPGDPGRPHQEPGAITDTGHMRTSGGLFPVPSDDAKQRIEDNWYQETMHFIRNNLLPMISPRFNEPPHKPDKGKAWVYDPVYGYKQVPDRFINKFLRNKVVN